METLNVVLMCPKPETRTLPASALLGSTWTVFAIVAYFQRQRVVIFGKADFFGASELQPMYNIIISL
jgi:hypothetical protein